MPVYISIKMKIDSFIKRHYIMRDKELYLLYHIIKKSEKKKGVASRALQMQVASQFKRTYFKQLNDKNCHDVLNDLLVKGFIKSEAHGRATYFSATKKGIEHFLNAIDL